MAMMLRSIQRTKSYDMPWRWCSTRGRKIAAIFGMLHWSLIFLIIALVAGVLGFTGIAGAAMGIAKILFFVFLVIWLVIFLVIRRAV
jgi:uncharacterized membrane protein YtjA (UPF0391 family)